MPGPSSLDDRNLLFAVLAFQTDVLDEARFREVCTAHPDDLRLNLGEWMVRRGWITSAQRAVVEEHIGRKLLRHRGSIEAAVKELTGDSFRKVLAQVNHPLLCRQPQGQPHEPVVDHSESIFAGDRVHSFPFNATPWEDELSSEHDEPWNRQTPRGLTRSPRFVNAAAILVVILIVGLAAGLLFLPAEKEREQVAQGRAQGHLEKGEGQLGRGAARLALDDRQRQVARIVDALFVALVRKPAVLEHLRNDPLMGQDFRAAALSAAEEYPQDPNELNDGSWFVVRLPRGERAAYERALLLAEEACRIAQGNGYYLNTLGVAQYRLGQYAPALKTLKKSAKINEMQYGVPHPADLAFIAMAQHQIGQRREALATRKQFVEVLKSFTDGWAIEHRAFARETDELLQEKNPKAGKK
jgi:tetratricopeptide (TPR) repeat protein